MNRPIWSSRESLLPSLALALGVAQPPSLLACAVCYGQSDSPMAAGMNWGILSLLGMTGVVLAGVAAFFIFLARRSVAAGRGEATTPSNITAAPVQDVGPAHTDEFVVAARLRDDLRGRCRPPPAGRPHHHCNRGDSERPRGNISRIGF